LRAAVQMLTLPIDKPTVKDFTELAVHE
jgi:hypothetical protein